MPSKLSEEITCKEMSDPQLEKADWFLPDYSRAKIEISVESWPSPYKRMISVVAWVFINLLMGE